MGAILGPARVLLYRLELADAAQIQLLFPHWEIFRYWATQVPGPCRPDGAHKFIRAVALPAVARGEAWHWTLRLASNPDHIIGSIDLRKKENDNRGFWLGLPWQRQGLMTEACEAVTDFWFETLHFPVLLASKAIGNVASRRNGALRTLAHLPDSCDHLGRNAARRNLLELQAVRLRQAETRGHRRPCRALPEEIRGRRCQIPRRQKVKQRGADCRLFPSSQRIFAPPASLHYLFFLSAVQ